MIRWIKRLLKGGLSLDLNNKDIAPEDYVFANNIYNGVARSGKHFIVQNIDGTRAVTYALPAGINKTIGRFEDKKDESCIYMVWNSNGDHSILRYYLSTNLIIKVLEEPLLNFDDTNPIGSINLVDSLFSWTTGDGNPPREFNIDRAQRQDSNGIFKPVEFNLYFDFVNFRAGDTYNIQYGANNILVYTCATDQSLEDGVRDFVTQFNAAQSDFIAESCGTFVEVRAVSGGIYDITFTFTGSPIVRVFTNIYPDDFLETFINADKNPPICEPTLTLKTDVNEKNNFIVSKIFQFQIAYTYVDSEKSSLSPFSIVSLGAGNYIELNFTDPRLNDENLTIIKGVQIYVQEGELGELKFVTELGRDEIGIGTNYFKFYNNKEYSVVDEAYQVKLHEAFPIKAGAQEVFDNRKGMGDITEGYDRVCVETQLTTVFEEPPDVYTIKGILVFRPLFRNSSDRNAAVGTDGTTIFWGLRQTSYGQELQLNGLPVYLAGTEFYGVTRQVNTWSTNQNQNTGIYNMPAAVNDLNALNQSSRQFAFRSGNPYNLGSSSDPDPVADGYEVRDQNGNYVGDKWFGIGVNQSSLVYSTFEINGVPEGEYIIRIGGGETTASDLNGTGYQNTSTYVIAVGSGANQTNPPIPQGFEYKIRVGATVTSYSNSSGAVTAEQAGNVIYVGCSTVADLSNTAFLALQTVITGYVCDSDLNTTPLTYNEILQDTRIERAMVWFNKNARTPTDCVFNNTQQPNWSQRAWVSDQAVTDHNGFFYYVTIASARINNITVGKPASYYVTYGQAFKEDNTPVLDNTFYGGYNRIAVRNINVNVREKAKTIIKGRVLDGTSPQQDVPVINALGTWVRTDQNGEYEIPCYSDTFYNSLVSPPADPVRFTEVVFSNKNNNLVYAFANDSLPNPFALFNVGVGIGSYNNTSQSFWYLISDNQADLLEQFLGLSGFKRGLSEEFGVIYYDRENRQTTVNDHIRKVYVPFYTENQTVGSARINWQITSLPPEWATHYQWVRTHSVPSFLQFNATSVAFVDVDDNVTSFNSATFIKIGFNSILDYNKRYPNSRIGYTFERGDRIKLISNGAGALFGTYLDAEVVKDLTAASDYYLYVEKSNTQFLPDVGTLFELYTPRPSSETTFFEFGECFETYIDNGVLYHKGESQDQTALQPATGTFRTGNVYYRFRNFVLGGAKYIEDSAVSDFYSSFTTQTGRPQILDKNAKQVHRPTLIRFSNKYLSGSSTNGFASFEALNQKEIDRVFGEIRIMKLMAQSVLLVPCENRTQTFYVNKATINIPSNTPNLISLSDAVLNTADTLIGDWGCSHKLSFDSYDNQAWWWDNSKGVVVRYSSNGLFPISDYKTKSYFNERSFLTNPNIVGGYDAFHNLYILSFGETNDRAGQTIVFNDGSLGGKNLWVSFYSFLPDAIGRIGNTLITFKEGSLYVHDSPVRNNFYGVQYTSQFTVLANDFPSARKELQSSALESLIAWNTVASVPANAMRPAGQTTRITKGKYAMKEGQFFSEFQGDLNSLGGIINGDKLRGEIFVVEYETDATEYTELYCINIGFTDSPQNI